jgi:hypothetical protein
VSVGSIIAAGIKKAGEAGVELINKGVEAANMGIKELANKEIEEVKHAGDAVKAKLDEIQNMTPDQLREMADENIKKIEELLESTSDAEEKSKAKEGLTNEEKQRIKEETGWSDEIVDAIGSMEEYEIYKKAGLVEAEIGGKKCLIRTDIDWDQVDEKGRTNTQRVERGLAPLDKNGDSIQLHHIGQHKDSPLAELTFEEHRCGGNDTILHDKSIESEAHGEGNNWDNERQSYWQNRADYNNNGGQET